MKKRFITPVLVCCLVFATFSSVNADPVIPDITSSFSKTMRDNAAVMAYYAFTEQDLGTWPIGTGLEFASKVKPGGVWDYKLTLGTSNWFIFNSAWMQGEDVGNMHYGYVGKACGFSDLVLKSAAGAVQIYAGTAHPGWYNSYFDDPKDQQWINYGLNLWNSGWVPDSLKSRIIPNIDTSLFSLLTEQQKREIEIKVLERSNRIKAGLSINN